VVAISECASRLIGDNDETRLCDTFPAFTGNTVSFMPSTKTNRIMMSGFHGTSVNIYANVDCNGKSLAIPKQTFMFYEVTGTGSYSTYDSVTIHYTLTSPTDTLMCTTGLKMKP
jgi:hypothetical protein